MWKKEDDWYWEGNVQSRIVEYLQNKGYAVSALDTNSKARGPDIRAQSSEEKVIIEVKGWPADKYVSGSQQGEKKNTSPTTQAAHWFGAVLFTLMKRKSTYPVYNLGFALPDFPRYRNLLEEVRWALDRLDFRVYLVSEDGKVICYL